LEPLGERIIAKNRQGTAKMLNRVLVWLGLIILCGCGAGSVEKDDLGTGNAAGRGLQNRLPADQQRDGGTGFRPVVVKKTAPNQTRYEWPQWRGPDRTDVSRETGLLQQWPEGGSGPERLWVSWDVGIGYSGPAVVDGVLYTMGALPLSAAGVGQQDGEQAVSRAKEYLIAMDAQTGQPIWTAEVGEVFENNWGNGPRSTPTVEGDFIYALGALGDLVCVEKRTGKVRWRKSFSEDFGGEVPQWGFCESVLIDGNRVICTPGGPEGAMAALDKQTGEVIWRSADFTDGAQYASIIAIENGGKRQYVQLTQEHLVGIDAENGELLWSIDWPGRVAVIPTPIFHDHSVYATSGYGAGCKRVLLDAENHAEQVYDKSDMKNMKNHHGGVILFEDHLYGYSDNVGWLCQDFATGKKIWAEKQELGKGAIAYADGRFYCIDENDGRVVLIDASPEGWRSRGDFVLAPQTELRKPAGRIWTHPVIVNGKLYLRDQELLHCYDVRQP
jgi:outer membrane protein assembly factor BamB